jgi:N-dimethylarginine dimethylaminohydrolase
MTNKTAIPDCPNKMDIQCFAMTAPNFVDTTILNNARMRALDDVSIDRAKFFTQWYSLYSALASKSLVYVIPALKGLQDQTYVNSFVALNIPDRSVAVISRFAGPERRGESVIAKNFLQNLYFEVYQCPCIFEGYPDLKFIRDNIFFGGHGIRTTEASLDWLSNVFGIEIIKVKMTNEYNYHLDCNMFVLDKENVLLSTETVSKESIRNIEKVANIHVVSFDESMLGICGSLKVGNSVLNSSSLTAKEYHKDIHLGRTCRNLGLNMILIDVGESFKSGGSLACLATPLNYL